MTKEEAIEKMQELRRSARTAAQYVEIITSQGFIELKKIAYPDFWWKLI